MNTFIIFFVIFAIIFFVYYPLFDDNISDHTKNVNIDTSNDAYKKNLLNQIKSSESYYLLGLCHLALGNEVDSKSNLEKSLEFGNIDLFQDHTGIVIAPKYLERMRKKYHRLHEARNQAKSNFDMEFFKISISFCFFLK